VALTQDKLPHYLKKYNINILKESNSFRGCILIEFPKDGKPVEVSPHMNADLPLSLTGWAAVWVDLEDSGLSAYHLRHPQNEQNSSAIEYINHKWYYLEQ